ncbi:MAG: DUF2935 domain-containing protein [bacterium]|nr:DUF2935 domain-containing protein [bacterium]
MIYINYKTLLIQQSLTNHLFYLRSMREFSLNIELSFFQNNQEEIATARDFVERCAELEQEVIDLSNGKLERVLLDSRIFVTNYTLDLELLTKKLFDVDIHTNLTEQEFNLIPKEQDESIEQAFDQVMDINQRTVTLANNFVDFCSSLFIRMKKNELFSYSYPLFYGFMIRSIRLYIRDLERIIQGTSVDPTYIARFEYYYSESMMNICQFITGLSDPDQISILNQAENFRSDYQAAMTKYQQASLTPESQIVLREELLELTGRFQKFIINIIQGILNQKLYFIVEPLFFDNMLTEVNYFLYLLVGSEYGINKTTSA